MIEFVLLLGNPGNVTYIISSYSCFLESISSASGDDMVLGQPLGLFLAHLSPPLERAILKCPLYEYNHLSYSKVSR